MSEQPGWRWCHKCDALFYSLLTSRCPAGGPHDSAGSGKYIAVEGSATVPVQDSWRWCNKCQGMFYAGGAPGPCPVEGVHNSNGSGSYLMLVKPLPISSQSNWRWCHRCTGLFYGGRSGGICPAGGPHSSTGSGDYSMKHESPAEQPLTAEQLEQLIRQYGPTFYFHPSEKYVPGSVDDFLAQATLHKHGVAQPRPAAGLANALPTEVDGENTYTLLVPGSVHPGNLNSAVALVRAKWQANPEFTDLQFWLFYPYNGAATAKAFPFSDAFSLAPLGSHEGDWEHFTLRIHNASLALHSVYLSQHAGGTWVTDPRNQLEWENNRPVIYASLNGHASYAHADSNLSNEFKLKDPVLGQTLAHAGLRNDTGRGRALDCSARSRVISTNFLPSSRYPEPGWLAYTGRWGRIVDYVGPSLGSVPFPADQPLRQLVNALPDDVKGESGPTGPTRKGSWNVSWSGDDESLAPNWLRGAGLVVLHQGHGDNGQLWSTFMEGSTWAPNRQVPRVGMSNAPSLAMLGGRLYCFHEGHGNNGELWYSVFDGATWSADKQVAHMGLSGAPSAVVFNGKLLCFHQGGGDNGELWYTEFSETMVAADRRVPHVGMSASPSAVVFNGKLLCFHQGGGDNGELWYTEFNGSMVGADRRVPNVGMSASPAAVVYNGKLYCFHQGGGNNGELWYCVFNGSSWSADQRVANVGMSASPTVAVWGGKLYCFHEGHGDNGELWYSVLDGTSWQRDTLIPNVGVSSGAAAVVWTPT